MATEPLQPFTGLPLHLALSAGAVLGWALLAVAIFWASYTVVAIYHWIKFSHAATVALPAIVIHLGVSVTLLLFALSGAVVP